MTNTFTFLMHTFKFKSDVEGGLLKGKSGKANEEREEKAGLHFPPLWFLLV